MASNGNKSFSATVTRNTRLLRQYQEAIFKQSVQEVLHTANLPKAQGGNMPVDTGYLRNSLTANLNSPAAGTSREGTNADEDVALVIAGATVNDVIWAGWTANYAKYQEYKNGFREGAAMQWRKIVNANVQRLKKMLK